MIDPERVCEMTKLAAYEKYEGKKYRSVMQMFRSDFVGRHLLKAFFCATAVYGILLFMWGVYYMDELMANLSSMDLIKFGTDVLVKYLFFLIVYLIAVYIYANLFYAAGRRNLKRHIRRLKKLGRLYREQEERTAPGKYDLAQEEEE